MKQKRLAALLALLMALSLTACGEEAAASMPEEEQSSAADSTLPAPESSEVSAAADGSGTSDVAESSGEEADTQSAAGADSTADSTQSTVNDLSPEMQAMVDSVNLDTAELSGVCGPSLAWYYRGGVLVISGSGPMNDFSWTDGNAPWEDLFGDISLIYLSDGVTSVGAWAFEDFWLLSRVVLPDSLESIGGYAFHKCENLPEMTIPASVKTVGENALGGTTITFLGDAPEPIEKDGYERLDIFSDDATVHYSGTGFDPFIQYYENASQGADITWVKD